MNSVNIRARQFIVQWITSLDSKQKLNTDVDSNLVEEGYLDSLNFINLIAALESEFSIELDLADMDPDEFTRLSGLAKAVVRGKKNHPEKGACD